MGSVGSTTRQGLGDEWIVTDFTRFRDSVANGESADKAMNKAKGKYMEILEKEGFFGTQEQLDEAYRQHNVWRDMERRRKDQEANPEWGYREVNAEEFGKLSWVESLDVYMPFPEFKKAMREGAGGVINVPGTMSEGFTIFYSGMSKNGYGQYSRGADAREIWDNKFKFSEYLDKHPNLKLNTDTTMYRGLRLGKAAIEQLQKAASNGDMIDMRGPSSWSTRDYVADEFAYRSLWGKQNKNQVIFENVTKGQHNAMPFIHGHDAEVIYSGNAKFKVMSVSKDEKGVYHVKVKEA